MYRIQRQNNKYGAKKASFGGRVYHSKKEASYAQELELRKHAGEIVEIIPQFKISLDVVSPDGKKHHICNHIVDFKLVMPDGSVELHEVKGYATQMYRLKLKLVEALYLPHHPDTEYVIVR